MTTSEILKKAKASAEKIISSDKALLNQENQGILRKIKEMFDNNIALN